MASIAPRLHIPTSTVKHLKCHPRLFRPGLTENRIVLVKATAEVAEVADALISADIANSISAFPVRDVSKFLLEHPVASFSLSVAALFILPKIIEAFIRYLAAPVAIALLAFYVLEFPEGSAVIITTVLDWINSNPELTSLLVIGLAILGLAPAIFTAMGATALVYALLSVSFGTQLPEVREMQGSFSETVTRVQFLSSIAAQRVEQLLRN
ncbi:hypothetical protein Vretifemale_18618 [Volvox reticuliferus]|uniref:Uncharacterized protein n=2 Tax=Volvox reticuliferus TaxID=1737510 RepID=A0A8J4CXK2_9CHLO|nr:hypothetical protein Vretifemale_18618 [Volvox reticuliferus]